jgi:hypothetical protein
MEWGLSFPVYLVSSPISRMKTNAVSSKRNYRSADLSASRQNLTIILGAANRRSPKATPITTSSPAKSGMPRPDWITSEQDTIPTAWEGSSRRRGESPGQTSGKGQQNSSASSGNYQPNPKQAAQDKLLSGRNKTVGGKHWSNGP